MSRKSRTTSSKSKLSWRAFARTSWTFWRTHWCQIRKVMKQRCSSQKWRLTSWDTSLSFQRAIRRQLLPRRHSAHTRKLRALQSSHLATRTHWNSVWPSTTPSSTMRSFRTQRRLALWLAQHSTRLLQIWTACRTSTTRTQRLSCNFCATTCCSGPQSWQRMTPQQDPQEFDCWRSLTLTIKHTKEATLLSNSVSPFNCFD